MGRRIVHCYCNIINICYIQDSYYSNQGGNYLKSSRVVDFGIANIGKKRGLKFAGIIVNGHEIKICISILI